MNTSERIKQFNEDLREAVKNGKNNPDFLKALTKKIQEGKEMLTTSEGVISRDLPTVPVSVLKSDSELALELHSKPY